MTYNLKDVYLKERGAQKGFVWHKTTLFEKSKGLIPFGIAVKDFPELEHVVWFGGPDRIQPTAKNIALHAKRILDADLNFPIILSQDGSVMDGMHRICKAYICGREFIKAVQFATDPDPDIKIHIDESFFMGY